MLWQSIKQGSLIGAVVAILLAVLSQVAPAVHSALIEAACEPSESSLSSPVREQTYPEPYNRLV